MKRMVLSILSAAGIAAASATMVGTAQAATDFNDTLVVYSKNGAEPRVLTMSGEPREGVDAVVVEKGEPGFMRDANGVVITPDQERIRTAVYFRDDGTMVVPLDGEVLSPPSSFQPTEFDRDTHDVYRVYDCDTIETQFEQDACTVQTQ